MTGSSATPGRLTVGVLVPLRDVAAVPAAQVEREDPDRAVHPAGALTPVSRAILPRDATDVADRRRAAAPPAGRALRARRPLRALPLAAPVDRRSRLPRLVRAARRRAVARGSASPSARCCSRPCSGATTCAEPSCECCCRPRRAAAARERPRGPARPRERRLPGRPGDASSARLREGGLAPAAFAPVAARCSCSSCSPPLAALVAFVERSCSQLIALVVAAARPPASTAGRTALVPAGAAAGHPAAEPARGAPRAARAARSSADLVRPLGAQSSDRRRKLAALVCRTTRSPAHSGRSRGSRGAGRRPGAPHGRADRRARLPEPDPARQRRAVAGVRAVASTDAGRKLRLTVAPGHSVIVLGYVGEPFLRFDRPGVAANEHSATAQGLRLVPTASRASRIGPSGNRSTRGHTLRLGRRPGVGAVLGAPRARDGRAGRCRSSSTAGAAAIRGELTRVAKPPLWPWIAARRLPVLAAAVAARRKRWLWAGATGLAAVAGLATLAEPGRLRARRACPSRPTAGCCSPSRSRSRWSRSACLTRPRARLIAVAALAAFAVLQALSELRRLPSRRRRLGPARRRRSASRRRSRLGAGLGAAGARLPRAGDRHAAAGADPKHPLVRTDLLERSRHEGSPEIDDLHSASSAPRRWSLAAAASAHAIMSPAVAKANALQQFTLSVPTEEAGATTTKIELTVPSSFAIDSFEPPPAPWKHAHAVDRIRRQRRSSRR